jgi:PleD family two-component response regulator
MYEDSLDDTIHQADMMLYNAKNSGRNQVCMEQ